MESLGISSDSINTTPTLLQQLQPQKESVVEKVEIAQSNPSENEIDKPVEKAQQKSNETESPKKSKEIKVEAIKESVKKQETKKPVQVQPGTTNTTEKREIIDSSKLDKLVSAPRKASTIVRKVPEIPKPNVVNGNVSQSKVKEEEKQIASQQHNTAASSSTLSKGERDSLNRRADDLLATIKEIKKEVPSRPSPLRETPPSPTLIMKSDSILEVGKQSVVSNSSTLGGSQLALDLSGLSSISPGGGIMDSFEKDLMSIMDDFKFD